MNFADLFTMPTPAICREKAAVTFGKESRPERMLRPLGTVVQGQLGTLPLPLRGCRLLRLPAFVRRIPLVGNQKAASLLASRPPVVRRR